VAIIDQGRIIVADSVANLLGQLGSAVLHVRLSDGSEDMRQRLASQLACERVSTGGDGVFQIGVASLSEALPVLLGVAEEAGVQIEDLQIARPSLEQVFLSLTGRRLRD
jgi:ABC-2 type transport system ATP-binding protein